MVQNADARMLPKIELGYFQSTSLQRACFVFYDPINEWAFGPLFESIEQSEQFRAFIERKMRITDLRGVPLFKLRELWIDFQNPQIVNPAQKTA